MEGKPTLKYGSICSFSMRIDVCQIVSGDLDQRNGKFVNCVFLKNSVYVCNVTLLSIDNLCDSVSRNLSRDW